jgi:hypothetical protein
LKLTQPPDTTIDSEDAISRLQQEAKEAWSVGRRNIRDITLDFTAASMQLQSGQLVKDEFFTLFEAVGALEVSFSQVTGPKESLNRSAKH